MDNFDKNPKISRSSSASQVEKSVISPKKNQPQISRIRKIVKGLRSKKELIYISALFSRKDNF